MIRIHLMVGLFVLVGVVGCSEKENSISYSVHLVKVSDVSHVLEFTGELEASEFSEIRLPVGASIQSLHFKDGDLVEKGQLIAVINDSEVLQEVSAAATDVKLQRITFTNAITNAVDAKKEFKSQERLYKDGVSSSREFQRAKRDLKLAYSEKNSRKTSLKQAEAKYRAVEKKKREHSIESPRSGILRIIYESRREIRPRSFVISESDQFEVRLSVNEIDVVKLKDGQEVSVQFDSLPEEILSGKISEISFQPERRLASQSNLGLVTYRSVVKIKKKDPRLRIGMTAKIRIKLSEVKNVLVLPIAAIQYRDRKPHVLVLNEKGEKIEQRIKLGLKGYGEIEVTSGLSEGDRVAIPLTGGE